MCFLHSGVFQNMMAKSQAPEQVDEVVTYAVTIVRHPLLTQASIFRSVKCGDNKILVRIE